MTRRAFFVATTAFALSAITSLFVSCGYPSDIDPMVYWGRASAQAMLDAGLHASDIPNGKGRYYWVQPTGSMRPLIDDYDWIVVDTGYAYSALKGGHVIMYNAEWSSAPVTHRLRQMDKYGWIVSGDSVRPDIAANGKSLTTEADLRVTEANYIGLVVAVYTTRQKP